MKFDDAARNHWEWFYAGSGADTPPGARRDRHRAPRSTGLQARAGLRPCRRSDHVGLAHLEAGIALADYARRSAVWALGDSTGNRHSDVLRRMLADGDIAWNDAKQVLGLRTAADLSDAVSILVDAGLAEVVTVPRPDGGRPRRVIRAKGAKVLRTLGARARQGRRSSMTPALFAPFGHFRAITRGPYTLCTLCTVWVSP